MSDHNRLTFINVSGSSSRNIGKDAGTKSKVRSQVMRNLRRKQRLDDQKKFEEAQSAFDDQCMSGERPTIVPRVEREKRAARPVSAPPQSGGERLLDLSLPHSSRPALPPSIPGSISRRLPPFASKHLPPGAAAGARQPRTPRPQPQSQQEPGRGISPVDMALSLHGRQIGGSNPSSLSPREFHKLIAIMESYTVFLSEPLTLTHPTYSPGREPDRTRLNRCLAGGSYDELVLFTVRLVHLGQTTAIKCLPENVPVCVCAKANALNRLQRSIRDVAQRPRLTVIGAVTLVLSFEMIRGSDSVSVHADGLARLVGLYNGLSELSGHIDVEAIIACDLILSAVCPQHAPRFTDVESPVFITPQSHSPAEFYQSSPLLQVESFESLAQLYDRVPQTFVEILNEAFQATQNHIPVVPTQLPRPQNQYDLMPQLSPGTMHTQDPSLAHGMAFPTIVLQASRLAATIYLRAAKDGIPLEDHRNHDDVNRLGALLHESPLTVWRGIPYIYLWVLLTGAAAAQSHPKRQYLVAELIRFGFSIALEHIGEFRQILINFIHLRRSL